jgi:hypothetical protein
MNIRKRWPWMAVVLAAVAATLYLTVFDHDGGAPAVAATAVTRPADIVLPLDHYLPTPAEKRRISIAVDRLSRRCMARLGYAFPVPDRSGVYGELPNARRYGLLDEAHAAADGYHQDAAEVARTNRIMSGPKLTEAASAVWSGDSKARGVPAGGCLGEANRALSGVTDPSQQELVHNLARDAFTRRLDDKRNRIAVVRWRDCMAKDGYRYASPFDALGDPRWAVSKAGSQASAAEIAVARSDVRCNVTAGVATTWLAVETPLQRDLIAQHRTELDAGRAVLYRQIAGAAVLAADRG